MGLPFHHKVASGEYVGRLLRDGGARKVVALEDPECPCVDIYYVSDDGFLVEWDQFELHPDSTISLQRDNRYVGFSTEPPEGEDPWTISPADRAPGS